MDKLSAACGAAAKEADFIEAMKGHGTVVSYKDPRAYAEFLKTNDKDNHDLSKELGLLKR
jgi:tripartite-type tricarboxylate transporter receptor subunit TctC